MKKVSEWLAELGSHEIYLHNAIAWNFQEETGEIEIPWKSSSYEQEKQAMDARGKGGTLDKTDEPLAAASDIAYACYRKYAGDEKAEPKFGMGSQFWEHVNAIKRAGN